MLFVFDGDPVQVEKRTPHVEFGESPELGTPHAHAGATPVFRDS